MLLGVPTLNRYDLLARLIASAEAGRLKPSDYFIVDNGGRFDTEAPNMPGVATALARGARFYVLTPDANLGVAASWNALLDAAGAVPMAISNDDVELGDDALEAIDRALAAGHHFVIAEGGYNANGWCLFAQTRACTELVGVYDEGFYPAYYEDSDYERRMSLVGITPHREPATLRHEGWATMNADPSGAISAGQQKSADYFQEKWGGMPGGQLYPLPLTATPENADFTSKWRSYTTPTTPPVASTRMRWDVDQLYRGEDGAKTYLEIGVAGGENMRNVRIERKTGVDPNPTVEGVNASDIFCPTRSDRFFTILRGDEPWDIAFIDGFHHADQAYRDIMIAASVARIIVVHDANPSTEMQRVPQIQSEWTGDVWKAIAKIRAEGVHEVRTVDTDYGVAVVVPNRSSGLST